MDFIRRVSATIERHALLSDNDGVIVALSAGADSVSMLLALHELSLTHHYRLRALYVDHGLRPDETPKEIAFCHDLCERIGVPFEARPVNVKSLMKEEGENKQQAARRLRYEALEAVALEHGARRIATGHTQDDRTETFFMRILRGSGPSGLAGIPVQRGRVIRPLFEVWRSEIEAFLTMRGQTFLTDSSNESDDYLRNRLRSQLMPMLKEINPSLPQTVARTMDVLTDEERYFFIQTTKAMMRLITGKSDEHIEFFLVPFESLDRAIARRVLRRAIDEVRGLCGIGHGHIEDILALVKSGSPGATVDLPHGVRAIKKYSTFLITARPDELIQPLELPDEGQVIIEQAALILRAAVREDAPPRDMAPVRHRTVLDADRVGFPLIVRSRRDGDWFSPAGMTGSKKLQDYFVDEKIPRHERDLVPVVTNAAGDIVWVGGYRADGRFLPDEGTKRFLTLELIRIERSS